MNAETRKQKRRVAIATVHLLLWFFVLQLVDKNWPEAREAFIAAGIALFVAAWIQYRAVLAYRRTVKSGLSGDAVVDGR